MSQAQLENAAAQICERFPHSAILGIDGWTGAGKTTLAQQIGTLRVPIWPLDIDAFLSPRDGKYKEALQLQSLRAAIKSATVPIVASGVCLLEVFQLIGLQLDSHIYLKRLNAGVWADEGEALGNDLETHQAAGLKRDVLRNEIRDYHLNFRPHEVADLVVDLAVEPQQVVHRLS